MQGREAIEKKKSNETGGDLVTFAQDDQQKESNPSDTLVQVSDVSKARQDEEEEEENVDGTKIFLSQPNMSCHLESMKGGH